MCSLVIALVLGWFFVTQISVYVMGGLWLLDTLFCVTEIREDDSELFRNSSTVYNEANSRNIRLIDRYNDVLMREKEERVKIDSQQMNSSESSSMFEANEQDLLSGEAALEPMEEKAQGEIT